MTGPGLARRFVRHVQGEGELAAGGTIVVGVSGGIDSVVLLHLLRFVHPKTPKRIVVAHLDHAMRDDGAADSEWVRGLARAWGLVARAHRLAAAPVDESEARGLRYSYLERVRSEVDATTVVTAHHADDQAETVLFRALRGTGLSGLRGILPRREPALWRPLLPFTRQELLSYAEEVGLSWREDSTNRLPYARNVLRHEILPRASAAVAPGASAALTRLARRARANEEGWQSLLEDLLIGVDLQPERQGAFSVDRAALAAHHAEVRARLLRELCRRLDSVPEAGATRAAVAFVASGPSGGGVELGRGVLMSVELSRVVISRPNPVPPDVNVQIPGPGEGRERARIGGRDVRVTWWTDGGSSPGAESFAASDLHFPLVVRGRRPGDRVRMAYGRKRLKKLLLEARIPSGDRERVVVLADRAGSVLWVPEVARSEQAAAHNGSVILYVEVEDVSDE